MLRFDIGKETEDEGVADNQQNMDQEPRMLSLLRMSEDLTVVFEQTITELKLFILRKLFKLFRSHLDVDTVIQIGKRKAESLNSANPGYEIWTKAQV